MFGQIGLSLAQTYMNAKGAKAEEAEQARRMAEASGIMDDGLENAMGYMSPFMNAGKDAIGQLQAILGGDTSLLNNGALGLVQNQAAERVEKSQAALGRTGAGETSGLIARAMAEPALNYENQRIGQLNNLFTTGANVSGNMGNIESNMATNKAQMITGQSNLAGGKYKAYSDGIGDVAGILTNAASLGAGGGAGAGSGFMSSMFGTG